MYTHTHIYLSLHGCTSLIRKVAARNWGFQVVIKQENQGGKTACRFFSLKNSAETPCTWQTPLVELADGDEHTGLKW